MSDAQGRVAAAYTALHGHPLEHDGKLDSAKRTYRWKFSVRAATALLAFALLLGVAALVASTWGAGSAVRELEIQKFGSQSQTAAEVSSPHAPELSDGESLPNPDPSNLAELGRDAEKEGAGGDTSILVDAIGERQGRDAQAINGSTVFVHVAGAVKRPGLYELKQNSRVHDAIVTAGEATAKADLNRLNLAQVLADGQQVYVPTVGEPANQFNDPSSGLSSATGTGNGTGLININLDSVTQLDQLPGVGPAIAQRIIDFRTEHGPFARLEDLQSVSGIGPTLLEKIKPVATTGS